MELDAHCFSDSDSENDETRSNSLHFPGPAEGAECSWAHPYEDMELIMPPARIELHEFPVVDLAHEAEAQRKREGKLISGGSCPNTSRAPGLTRVMGKGSWTIKVSTRGGVARVQHRENPGPERRTILPCVEREGTSKVMVGTLGGDGWGFSEVALADKRAVRMLWPKDKWAHSAAKGGGKGSLRLPEDLSEMTPEERILRERRDEKNRKERERRAQLKVDKLAKREAELTLAAAAEAAIKVDGAAPCGPRTSTAPTTPAPGTPSEMSEAGTPLAAVKAAGRRDFMEVDIKHSAHRASTISGASTPIAANSHYSAGGLVQSAMMQSAMMQSALRQPHAKEHAGAAIPSYISVAVPVAAPAKQPHSATLAAPASPATSSTIVALAHNTPVRPVANQVVSSQILGVSPAIAKAPSTATAASAPAAAFSSAGPVQPVAARPLYAGKTSPQVLTAVVAASSTKATYVAPGPSTSAIFPVLPAAHTVPASSVVIASVVPSVVPPVLPSLLQSTWCAAMPVCLPAQVAMTTIPAAKPPASVVTSPGTLPGNLAVREEAVVTMVPAASLPTLISSASASTIVVLAHNTPLKPPASAELAPTKIEAAPARASTLVASAPSVAVTGLTTPKDVVLVDDAMHEDPADKENLQDDEGVSVERGRCELVDDSDDNKALSKRRRLADLSPDVNCRGEAERAVRPRGVQRA
mmetsp:Transcript_97972/g.157995  ORF Transcript_97972/g.157995 Transcript_97972/m.157995 type:complete len:697 (-) Transcript_97972:579-2669(-)